MGTDRCKDLVRGFYEKNKKSSQIIVLESYDKITCFNFPQTNRLSVVYGWRSSSKHFPVDNKHWCAFYLPAHLYTFLITRFRKAEHDCRIVIQMLRYGLEKLKYIKHLLWLWGNTIIAVCSYPVKDHYWELQPKCLYLVSHLSSGRIHS